MKTITYTQLIGLLAASCGVYDPKSMKATNFSFVSGDLDKIVVDVLSNTKPKEFATPLFFYKAHNNEIKIDKDWVYLRDSHKKEYKFMLMETVDPTKKVEEVS